MTKIDALSVQYITQYVNQNKLQYELYDLLEQYGHHDISSISVDEYHQFVCDLIESGKHAKLAKRYI